MDTVPNFMVVRQLAMGDVLLATPIIRQLYEDYSGKCHIDVLTLKPEIFLHNPYIRQIFTPDTFGEVKGTYIRVINLDLAYENMPHVHIVDAYAMASHGAADKINSKRLELFPSDADRQRAQSIQAKDIAGDYVVVHMRKDTWPSRNLPDVTWRKILDILLECTDFKIVQVGSPHEIAFDYHPRLLNMLGRLNIQELRQIIAGAQCYVGVDSGTLHVAACTDTPIIAMFSSAHHRLREPLERPPHARFIPIQPAVDCYGCQEHYPPPITGVICHRGDPYSPPCKDAFDVENIRQALMDLGLAEPVLE
jgi:ADP-heptose:LPS heptosyltransferase